jgi:uncharacterized protein YxeA
MKQNRWIVLAVSTLAISMIGRASAQEKKLNKSDLPAAVQKTADEQSKGATVKGYSSEMDQDQLLYEVQMTVNGHSKDVNIDKNGKVVEVEEEVVLDSLPSPVKEALQKKAGAGKITKVESLTKHGALVAYEAQVRTGNKHSEIQVGPGGEALAHPE